MWREKKIENRKQREKRNENEKLATSSRTADLESLVSPVKTDDRRAKSETHKTRSTYIALIRRA